MGTEVQPQALLPCLAELETAVEGWQRRVRLEWPYGGGRVELSGEAVGGWDQKVALAFDVQRRNWALWLWVSGTNTGVAGEGSEGPIFFNSVSDGWCWCWSSGLGEASGVLRAGGTGRVLDAHLQSQLCVQ